MYHICYLPTGFYLLWVFLLCFIWMFVCVCGVWPESMSFTNDKQNSFFFLHLFHCSISRWWLDCCCCRFFQIIWFIHIIHVVYTLFNVHNYDVCIISVVHEKANGSYDDARSMLTVVFVLRSILSLHNAQLMSVNNTVLVRKNQQRARPIFSGLIWVRWVEWHYSFFLSSRYSRFEIYNKWAVERFDKCWFFLWSAKVTPLSW